jgi:hypothetical protein
MRIWLKPDRLAAYGISATSVREALARNNYLSALGRTKGSMVSVNLVANTDLQTAEEFRQLVVKEQRGVVVRLGDIADVVLGAENYDEDVRFNGETATFMGIWVLPTANSLEVIRQVRAEIPGIAAQMPAGMKVGIPYDSTEYIQDAINEVLTTLSETLLIVIVVIFLFLGSWRSVIIPIVAIPISLVGAVFLMLLAGFTVNLLTLLAIVLSVGLVVDDAIVMVENIERHLQLGKPPGRAAIEAARDRIRRRRADAVADDGREAAAHGRRRARFRRLDQSALRRRPSSLHTLRRVDPSLPAGRTRAVGHRRASDGALLHVLAARTGAHRRPGCRVLRHPGVCELHNRPDQAVHRASRGGLQVLPGNGERLSAHVSDRWVRGHGDQALERTDEDYRRAADGVGTDAGAGRGHPSDPAYTAGASRRWRFPCRPGDRLVG